MWMMLSPREVELVMARAQKGTNGSTMHMLQEKLDPLTGEMNLTDAEVAEVRHAAAFWRGGSEKALKAVVSAIDRHA